jgi:DNA polymerase III subunit delta
MTSHVYLLAGESFLADEAVDKIRQSEETDPLSEIAFDATAEPASLIEALQTASLLGGRRLVVVHDAQDLKKDQVKAVTEYLESPSGSSVLVLIASGRSKLDAAVKKTGTVVALEAPKGRKLVTWLRQRGTEHRLKLDDRAAWGLIDSVGTNLRDLDGALEQLMLALGPGSRVSATEVQRAFPRLADQRIFAFTDAVGERKLAPAMLSLRRLLEQGDEPLMLFGALSSHLRKLLKARRHADQGTRGVAAALGLPDWRAERMAQQARSYKEEELVDALSILAQTDIDMKGEFPSPEAALERAVVRIVSGQEALLR